MGGGDKRILGKSKASWHGTHSNKTRGPVSNKVESKDRHPRLSSDPHMYAVAFPTCIHTSYIHMRETEIETHRETLQNQPNYTL